MAFSRNKITDARPASYASTYDLVPPVTSYAASFMGSPMATRLVVPRSQNITNSAVVKRRPRRNGLNYHYSHGGTVMPYLKVPCPGAGGVASSRFQTILVQLHDWVINTGWHQAGYPRNLGLVTRVGQLETNTTGGSTSAQMQQSPIFPRVQRVPRYVVNPATYLTRSANG
jgi:hypothetical protein